LYVACKREGGRGREGEGEGGRGREGGREGGRERLRERERGSDLPLTRKLNSQLSDILTEVKSFYRKENMCNMLFWIKCVSGEDRYVFVFYSLWFLVYGFSIF